MTPDPEKPDPLAGYPPALAKAIRQQRADLEARQRTGSMMVDIMYLTNRIVFSCAGSAIPTPIQADTASNWV